MIAITCADVILRRFGFPVAGAYDLVKLLSAITLAAALPYTTAVKGHVAIEFFFHKLGRKSRIAVDAIMRCISSSLFTFLTVRSFMYGIELYRTGQVTQTLQLPVFWIAHVISFCCLIVTLVILYNLVNPNREMIKL
ncbi:MAG: TRAP transporter small permease [Sedimentisphaeraceae bacterium JB056]